jgi:hypothetical protein
MNFRAKKAPNYLGLRKKGMFFDVLLIMKEEKIDVKL